MNFEEILKELGEQFDPNNLDTWGQPIGGDDNANQPQQPEEPTQPDTDDDIDDGQTFDPDAIERVKPKKKKLKPIDVAKQKWLEERPGLNDNEIDTVITEFNNRKNNLRPFQGTLHEPSPENVPEVTALKEAFPDFPAEDAQKLKDVTQYTWEQLEFLIDRWTNAEAVTEMEFEVRGDTKDDRWKNALAIWKGFIPRQQIYKDEDFIVNRVEGKDEAQALGNIQHILVGETEGNKWCITRHPGAGDGSNLYNSYREEVSYYFVLDMTKERHSNYYVSVIQPLNPNYTGYRDCRNEGSDYKITPRSNYGSETMCITWDRIVELYPKMAQLKNQIKYFGTTEKEDLGSSLDNISMEQGHPHDLAIKSPRIQRLYIEANRFINSPRVFLSMNKDLQKLYIAYTKLEDYKKRFASNDPSKPFAMLDALSNKNKKFLHESVLQRQLGIPDGIFAIKAAIIKLQYNQSYSSIENPNLCIFWNKLGDDKLFGMLDLRTLRWVHDIAYRKSKPKLMMVDGRISFVFKYVRDNDDYFFFVLDKKNALGKDKDDPARFKGKYFDKEQGDNKFGNRFA